MEIRKVFGSDSTCSGGSCPTIYETDRNTFVVQGYILTKEDKEKLSLPVNEDVVELPMDFLNAFIKKA